jgi:hypothetical protein
MGKFKRRRLPDAYRFAGLVPMAQVHGVFGDPKARVVVLRRRQKKRRAGNAAGGAEATTISASAGCGICPVGTRGFCWSWRCGGSVARFAGV